MKNRLKIKFVVFLFLTLPVFAHAEWYWISVVSDPNTGYFIEEISPNTIGYTSTDTTDPYSNKTLVPENFMDTMDETKTSDKCSDELDYAIQKLRQFDANEEIVNPSLKCGAECSPYYADPEQTMAARKQLLLDLETDAQSCLIKEQEEIDAAIEERERKDAEEARIVEVKKAVSECDFDYFENEMTNKERMATWNERQECAEVIEENETVSTATEPVQSTQDVQNTPIVAKPISPDIPHEEQVTPAQAVTDEVETNDIKNISPTSTDDLSSTTDTTVNTSDPKIEQANIQKSEQQERPTILKRIVSFFSKLFSW